MERVAMSLDDFNELDATEQHRLWELYMHELTQHGVSSGGIKAFLIWLEER